MLIFFFFACLFSMEPSEWFCVSFLQKRNKAATVQLVCENWAKHEESSPSSDGFLPGRSIDPQRVADPKEMGQQRPDVTGRDVTCTVRGLCSRPCPRQNQRASVQ